ncbi:MAG: phosphatase PAP2 family protein [Polyangiaceae bacterium]|nr:phosphatase PAP2 family protein [Polyangiaceae bacterium]
MNVERAWLSGASIIAAWMTFSTPCAAQQAGPPNHPDWAFGAPLGEALLVLSAAASNLTTYLPIGRPGWGPDAHHEHNKTADRVSDFTGAYGGLTLGMIGGFAFETGYYEEAQVRGSAVYAGRTTVVDAESILFSAAIVQGLKRVTARCRPHHFVNGKCTSTVHDAFPSGHTAPMGALAGTRLVFAAQSAGPWGYRWGAFAMVETMALTTAWLRVFAGKHSWSDVAAGYLIGHAVGALVALAHPMKSVPRGDRKSEPTQSTGQSLEGTPIGFTIQGVF